MSAHEVLPVLEFVFLIYFIILQSFYVFLNVVASFTIRSYLKTHNKEVMPGHLADINLPVSIIVPAFNEGITIISSIKALLQLRYKQFEVVIVNDGSTDDTVEHLIREFDMVEFPEAYRRRLDVKPIRKIYQSKKYPQVRLIDKENGGKADALNTGINAAKYPLFCGVDADSILQPDSLDYVVQPFMEDPRVVASGGIIRIANGCNIRKGYLVEANPPKNWLALFQVMEYIRAFLFGRLGWTPLNALLIVSGAFGVFHKETVIAVGGYLTDTIGEDMELIVRMHRKLSAQGRKYRIAFVPDPICWTEAPEDFKTLANQRVRWQRGLAESLSKNMGLMFHYRGGAAGWIAFPFMFVFELVGPIIEVFGYLYFATVVALGRVSLEVSLAFFMVSIGFGIFVSVIALFLEEISYRVYARPSTILKLFLVAIVENFGYRQINTWWRFKGLYLWLTGKKAAWGTMQRNGSWQQQHTPEREIINKFNEK